MVYHGKPVPPKGLQKYSEMKILFVPKTSSRIRVVLCPEICTAGQVELMQYDPKLVPISKRGMVEVVYCGKMVAVDFPSLPYDSEISS